MLLVLFVCCLFHFMIVLFFTFFKYLLCDWKSLKRIVCIQYRYSNFFFHSFIRSQKELLIYLIWLTDVNISHFNAKMVWQSEPLNWIRELNVVEKKNKNVYENFQSRRRSIQTNCLWIHCKHRSPVHRKLGNCAHAISHFLTLSVFISLPFGTEITPHLMPVED